MREGNGEHDNAPQISLAVRDSALECASTLALWRADNHTRFLPAKAKAPEHWRTPRRCRA